MAGGALLAPGVVHAKAQYKWKMVTAWPKNFPGLGVGANQLAKMINEMSGGRIKVKVYGANELVPAFEVFDAVSRGTAQMGHSGAYTGKARMRLPSFLLQCRLV
ncbi:TRAP dicarboxylate transporter subunit DctP [methanotrophic bacterial endosymbiont of Bathymodiolus sp.]|nr:TRAP dicarboxylate transporter subunit DctP [methanotrophic bacterial endosymbiont of Bathymodiolus sp.]